MVNWKRSSLNEHSNPMSPLESCGCPGPAVNPPERSPSGAFGRRHLRRITRVLALLAVSSTALAAPSADPASCAVVRFSDVGWTDVTSTTALAQELLRSIGYSPRVTVLSVPVTFASLQNNDLDVFLGNWMPTQEADIRHSCKRFGGGIGANLVGANTPSQFPPIRLPRD